ncbi:heavy metal translocating P-type ATPase [Microbacterium sp. cx-55]|uniref:heavy metal translocating P-type ATPase n=1 Tax=Microbacterium sp. cx-55 TaxID=2875948 RepID=UPI001CBD1F95|nr:heavy metal translocating P-type ATPase [Microbacterium sp. cx-55]MBZ4488560.1 heavy metal translocating P-type ATPase [Microbacterium sp. cx-55]UGB36141.1 heavy metal translocating P-type ATPase [Microbacterium sp. cx-55]
MSEHPMGGREAVLEIQGMTCASCVARVEKRLQAVDGVSAAVNLATETARVSFPDDVEPARLVSAVAEAGYTARVRSATPPAHDHSDHGAHDHSAHDHSAHDHSAHEHAVRADDDGQHDHGGHVHDVEDAPGTTSLRTRLIVSIVLAVPVVALGMVPAWQFAGWQWVSLVLTAPIVAWGGWPFHRATFANLRHGALTMDTLITLGTGAAFGWSLWALLFGSAGTIGVTHEVALFGRVHDATSLVYFEVAAAVTVFLLLGRFIEQRSRRRAGAALRALGELVATEVLRADGRVVPLAELRVGDEFVARPGEAIATDGVVIEGRAAVDESMLTGESVPAQASPGSTVTGGTIARDGAITVRATAVGADTRLAAIARLVENAQLGKSRVQRLADRISGVFVPIVIALAVLTFVGWMALGFSPADGFTAAVAVLIIACPCALGLATPIAVLVGTGRGAQLGVLITGPDALENADRIDTVVFDKTGTLTEGRMALAAVVTAPGGDEQQARRIVGALEARSEHPVARALAVADAPRVEDFRAEPGRGVTGVVEGRRAFAGNLAFATAQGVILPFALTAALRDHAADGTAVIAGWDAADEPMRARAVFIVSDTLRPDAADAVAGLRAAGIRVRLVTGDTASIAERIAAEAGIDEVVAGVTPEGKVAEIERLRGVGRRVAMIGDGVNDSAALATADLGIAMGGGTDAARHASDITLTGSRPGQAVVAVRLSRRVMRTIRQNLFWAFAYNVAALPLAALGLLNPMIAGAAMAFSSVFVVLNSLRLRRAG